MFVAINFNDGLEIPREEIEDLILDALADRARVTGGGMGVTGGSIDLEVEDGLGPEETLRRLRQALGPSEGVPRDTEIQIGRDAFPLHPDGRSGRKDG